MGIFLKSCFFEYCGSHRHYSNLVSISKFQRSRLTFDLLAKGAHIGVPLTYLNIVFSETTRSIELKFHMTTPYDWLTKICTNCYGHMTKMAATPIYGKAKHLLLWNQNANGLGTYYVATRFAQMMNLG